MHPEKHTADDCQIARSKGAELSYKLGYWIMEALFHPVHPVCPDLPDIIRILWISMFRGNCPHFVVIYKFHGYYLHIVDIVDISIFRGYYLYWQHYNILSS